MIAIGNKTTHNTANASSDSFAWDSGSGSNRILIAGFSNFAAILLNREVSSCSYGGSALTQDANAVADDPTATGRAEMWYLKNPPTGSNTFSVTFGGTITNSDFYLAIFTGVDQTNSVNIDGNHVTVLGTSDTVSLVTTVDNCYIVDVMNGDIGPMSFGSSQTSLMNLSGSTSMGGYKSVGVAGTFTSVYTTSGNDDYAHGALALAPAAITNIYGTNRLLSGVGS